jgi:hypothetical protein
VEIISGIKDKLEKLLHSDNKEKIRNHHHKSKTKIPKNTPNPGGERPMQ